MQESINMAFGLIIGAQLYSIQKKENTIKTILPILLTVFIAGLCRPLWFFCAIPLVFYAKDKNNKIYFSIIAFCFIVISFCYTKYFLEAVPTQMGYFPRIMQLLSSHDYTSFTNSLATHFLKNIFLYLTYDASAYGFGKGVEILYLLLKYVNFICLGILILARIREKNPYYSAIIAWYVINFLLLFGLYDAADWREIRTLSSLYLFTILFIIDKKIIANIFVFIGLILLPISYHLAILWVDSKIINPEELRQRMRSYAQITQFVKTSSSVYVMTPSVYDLLALPLCNDQGGNINYLYPLGTNIDSAQYKIAPPNAEQGTSIKLYCDHYFCLYRIPKK